MKSVVSHFIKSRFWKMHDVLLQKFPNTIAQAETDTEIVFDKQQRVSM